MSSWSCYTLKTSTMGDLNMDISDVEIFFYFFYLLFYLHHFMIWGEIVYLDQIHFSWKLKHKKIN